MDEQEKSVRWAPKVRREKIRRLYETDARGICDEALIDDVGYALHLRCVSILEVTEAVRGRPKCHGCGFIIDRQAQRGEILCCPACGWEIPWKAYQRSYQDKQLFGGDALGFFQEYASRFLNARTPKEKLLLIDRLIHEFHWYQKANKEIPAAVRPSAANLIGSRGIQDVVEFLDALTYSGSSSPETVENRDRWREFAGINIIKDGESRSEL